jgi:hypothetical protein
MNFSLPSQNCNIDVVENIISKSIFNNLIIVVLFLPRKVGISKTRGKYFDLVVSKDMEHKFFCRPFL